MVNLLIYRCGGGGVLQVTVAAQTSRMSLQRQRGDGGAAGGWWINGDGGVAGDGGAAGEWWGWWSSWGMFLEQFLETLEPSVMDLAASRRRQEPKEPGPRP